MEEVKKKSKPASLTATKLRAVLISSIVLLVGLSGAAFWFFNDFLVKYAEEVQNDNATATVSSNDISRLKQLQQELEDDKVAVTRAKSIVADSKYYQYQDQIITDITAYAKSSGVLISGFSFDAGKSGPVAPAAGAATTPAPAGLKSTTATINLKSPVDYKSLMRFVHAIELNLTKMQISGLNIQRDPNSSGLTVDAIIIQVYTR